MIFWEIVAGIIGGIVAGMGMGGGTLTIPILTIFLKVKHLDMFNNYKALIALKQNANVFGKDATAIASDVSIEKNDNGSLIIMKVKDTLNKVEYIICHSNGVNGTKVVNLDLTNAYNLESIGTSAFESDGTKATSFLLNLSA